MKNCAAQVALMTTVMPRSGCLISSRTVMPKVAMLIRLPGIRWPSARCRANIQAVKIAKQGFRNSEGCSDTGPTSIQRVAPLISMPEPRVIAVNARKNRNSTTPRRRTWRGVNTETAISTAAAAGSIM
jgi:hypothetical protein